MALSLLTAYLPDTQPTVSRALPLRRMAAFAPAALVALALAGTALPAQAFLGLLGKAASGAGKAAAGTAGKTAGVGAAAGAATLADDAARAGGKAAAVDGAVPPGSGALASSVNAALPPEVAMYLAKPAASLTGADTAHMMDLYHRMVAQAGKNGDFTVAERLPSAHAAPKTLGPAVTPAPTPATTATATTPAATGTSASAGAEIGLHALRLLAHAASAGNRAAQSELRQRCADPALRKASADMQAQCKATKA
jgi:hypothetical protein